MARRGLNRICSECKKHSPTTDNCCAVRLLSLQPDFLAQRPLVREVIEDSGHKVIFYPKFHCELNFIEMFWGAAKCYTRNNCDYSFKGLEKTVPEALNSISLETIRCYARRAWRFMDAYRKKLTGIEALQSNLYIPIQLFLKKNIGISRYRYTMKNFIYRY